MVMAWNAEADAKLFLGVLNLLKDSKTKLDCEYLAKFMGPDCLPGAVQNRIVRLKRMAEKGGAAADGAGPGAENADEDAATADGQVSPQKRKAGRPRGAKASAAKKVKGDAKVTSEVKVKVEEIEMEMEMDAENEKEETEDMETEDVA
ncbi:hypothetical protein BJY01DRAFT_254106 [Aspergillus pseudoustus]|uniref:Uncharacterized protein n=1 Tax=Aspergillus pseudoustus TaxID=1810923 RepID=A0ABR4IWC0_9EURO